MKANNIDGTIKIFVDLPKQWKNHLNFRQADIALQEQEGFFDVEIPEYDYDLQKIGEIYMDEVNNVFTYPVENIVIDLEAEKALRKAELQTAIEDEIMLALGVGVLEKLAMGEPIPQSTKDLITQLRIKEADTITEIDSFSDATSLLKYKILPEDIENSKELLKSERKV